jgi:glycosyltransferase involved in cell wall biosynthesis
VHACTVATRSGLAHVRVLAASFHACYSGGTFTCLLADGWPDGVPSEPPIQMLEPVDVGLADAELRSLALCYDDDELVIALRPMLLGHLQTAAPDDGHVFLAPGTVVVDRIDEVEQLAREHEVALVPRVLQPVPRDGRVPSEPDLLAQGLFLPDILAVGPGSAPFLRWWAERMGLDGRADDDAAPAWLDFVPVLFDHAVCRDPGVGVSVSNLHERRLRRTLDGRVLAGDSPLRTLHLGGYDPERAHLFDATHGRQARVLLHDDTVLAGLVDDFGSRLEAAGIDRWRAEPYRFGTIAGGPVPASVRRLARYAFRHDTPMDPPPIVPFGPEGDEAFIQWLNEPEAGDGNSTVTRLVLHVWRHRPDLQRVFPHPDLADIQGLARWATTAADFIESHGHLHAPPEAPNAIDALAPPLPGLNIIGQLRGEYGLGEAGRLMTRAAVAAGVPHRIVSVDEGTSLRQLDPFVTGGSDGPAPPRYAVNLLCMNGDYLPRLLARAPASLLRGIHRVGFWFWEVDVPPRNVGAAFDLVDEVWVASDFVAGLFRPHTDKPVRVAPLAIIPPPPTSLRRSDLGLPDDRVVILASFDHLSVPERKNPLGVIRAYTKAFDPDDGAHLLLKSTNGSYRRDMMAEVVHLARDRPDIEIRDRYHSRTEMNALVQLCDVCLSLHRAEGFGLMPATAMAVGKPVVATGYSGNLAFMDTDNSLLVPYDLVPVGEGVDVYAADARWAEPDLDAAADHLRWIVDHPGEARLLGNRARASVARTHSLAASGEWISRQVEEIALDRLARGAVQCPA